jgi:carbon storage regulator
MTSATTACRARRSVIVVGVVARLGAPCLLFGLQALLFGLARGLGGLDLGRDERVVLGAQVDLVVEVDAGSITVLGVGRQQLVLALEGLDLLDRRLELMGDPGVGTALADPAADLVEVWAQRATCHARETLQEAGCRPAQGARTRRAARTRGCLYTGNVIEWHWRQGGWPYMLVLTRKSNQSIMIGDEIEISVLSIMGEKVRIGIQAPRDIPVFRKEVYLEIQAERGQVTATPQVEAALRKLST